MGMWKRVDTGLRGYERLGAIVGTTILIAAPVAGGIYWLRDHRVAAWVPIAVGAPLLLLACLIWLLKPGREVEGPTRRERDLERELEQVRRENTAAAEATTAAYEEALARPEYEKRLLTEALESLQQALGSEEMWDINALVERGVLGPVRGLLVRSSTEDVRLSVLVPSDDPPQHWRMRWAAGHRPESVRKYAWEIDNTIAGFAFRRGDYVERDNVQEDADFKPNPKETRPFKALVAVPLRIDEQVVGVLSVVSTVEGAFGESDVSFIRVVGALLDVILAAEHDFGRITAWMGVEEPPEGA